MSVVGLEHVALDSAVVNAAAVEYTSAGLAADLGAELVVEIVEVESAVAPGAD